MEETVAELARRLRLEPHPEGGYYRRTYESSVTAHLPDSGGWPAGARRLAATSIMYLLPTGGRSSLHQLLSDELWFWHSGSPITVVELTTEGARSTVLGAGNFTHRVHAGAVFGCFVPRAARGTGALVSCVVVPGFDFEDWRMPTREALHVEYPACAPAIDALSCDAVDAVPEHALPEPRQVELEGAPTVGSSHGNPSYVA